ncbi:hypothetical protein [Mammaliicoccus sciuri]|uniref:hypothetical protein n=1 Tax=Mammaliicoccus sciuri TaxID=1296 RepID=UPI003AE1A396
MTEDNQKVVLYVFSNEYKEAVGIYEEEEINEFYKCYTSYAIELIEGHYTIEEQIEYHLETIGKMVNIINQDTPDLIEYIDKYNSLVPDEITFEKIEVNFDDQQLVTNYIFDYGIEKYYENKNNSLLPKFDFKWNRSNGETVLLERTSEYQKDADRIIKYILLEEFKRLYKFNTIEELLFNEWEYIQSLYSFVAKVQNVQIDNMNTLLELQRFYNNLFYSEEADCKISIITD